MSPKRLGDVTPASNASSVHSPTASSTSKAAVPPSNKKRRGSNPASVSATGSRGVANLTPEQLAKKRANDREAQRAIRERTKNQIETLEKRIQELTSQQPYQELQHAIRQKELVEAENADIKRRLAHVLSLLQPLLGGNGLGDPSFPAYDGRGPSGTIYGTQPDQAYSPSALSSRRSSILARPFSLAWQASSPHGVVHIGSSMATNGIDDRPRGRPTEPTRRDSVPSLLRTTSAERQALGLLPVHRPEIQAGEHVDEGHRTNALPADSHITISSPRTHDPDHLGRMQHQQQSYRGNPTQMSVFTTIPTHTPPSCLLDGLFLDFIAETRQLAAEGASEVELVGPAYPDFAAIMYPEQRQLSHGISKVFADILSTFPDISSPAEKIATYYGMFLTMRWHVCPTQENYERLPVWLRPTSWQILTPHPIWIDHLPWPEMREELVRQYQRYPFENFFVPFTKTMSVNWPYDAKDIFLPPKQGSDELVLNPRFESHFADLNNWSLGSIFAQSFPLLSTGIRILDHEKKD